MHKPLVAVISFPGNNCEVESVRAVRKAGMEALYFRWNDDRAKLNDVDAYFIPGGFSYEDRGRSGMVAGRDPLMDFIGQEAERGKTVIGNCNGAQILVESGLIPLGEGLRMSLARNAVDSHSPGFLSQWIWMTPSCSRDRCATSDWEGAMHLPIAHGEGRFTTSDKDLFAELKKNNQIAFSYCDADGKISTDPIVTPNGSTYAVAGICNPEGNVVAIMPHPERTENGDPYFAALRSWLGKKHISQGVAKKNATTAWDVTVRTPRMVELFIDTIIVNNEERTVEQTARRLLPTLKLKQWKYLSLSEEMITKALSDLTVFNPHKERAFVRRHDQFSRWNADAKKEERAEGKIFGTVSFLRRDIPDTGAGAFGEDSQTGICYSCNGITESDALKPKVLEIFANPHASTLERLQ